MADLETETKQQELERASLQGVISQMQGALMFATAEARPALATALRNASSRLGVVEKKIQELQTTRETQMKEQTNAVVMAQNETRLNQQERNTFAGFLKEDFFTKADFGKLEDFYTKSWDRLSEQGKDAMSHRIWEGIRKDKYTFGELPPKVREKEMERAYGVITKQSDLSLGASRIPENDRNDFIWAYEAGKHEEAARVLERESFKKALFRAPESAAIEHGAVIRERDPERPSVAVNIAGSKAQDGLQKAPEAAKAGDKDLAAFGLDGVKLVDVPSQGTSADIPNARTAPTVRRESTPGS